MKNFRKMILGTIFSFCFFGITLAQGNSMVFSGVLRDNDGFVQNNTQANINCRLIDKETKQEVYSEQHSVTTDAMGQMQIPLGSGKKPSLNFADIDFSKSLDIEIYNNDRLITKSSLSQVPQAAFATRAQSANTANTAGNANTAAKLQGKVFNDEAEAASNNIWSSAKMAKMIDGQTGQTGLAKEITERKKEDLRIWDSINLLNQKVVDSLAEIWDSINALKLQVKENMDNINYCLLNDADKGIYTTSIPLYSVTLPDTIGLFTNPLMKVIKQSGDCDLIKDLNLVSNLKKSYKTSVLTYNTSENIATPKSVIIPASTVGLDIYVDNLKTDAPIEYFTYDVLVFEVEYFYLGESINPKLYVTLVRE